MTKESTNKPKGWFKGILSSPVTEEEAIEVIEETIIEEESTEEIEVDTVSTKSVFTKENQDKVSLDLIVALENMLKDRQLILYKNTGLEDSLYSTKESVTRLKQELMKKEQQLQEKISEISLLESKLTDKQMSYDQLLEDYKEYQNTSNSESDNIRTELEKEVRKYNKLTEEATQAQYQAMLKNTELEERIRELEVENQNNQERYEKVHAEKEQLLQTINEFTQRISFSPPTK
ncbi:hypothetical protein [Bacillus suaedaesalsae]|uniref:Uncharacterized protein n=1 Tax=Bacillus suaedaesalsae TaxID=2810349 RepID=A0ABS2DEL0_9BACI|nr:hypothetical protein [Bacillus suaedaesalsae]MBM6616887.1 hypothetical protein [Bacillus suaedaesalsae]